MRKYVIDVTSQRYSGFNLLVDVRDADTKEFLFTTRKNIAEEIIALAVSQLPLVAQTDRVSAS